MIENLITRHVWWTEGSRYFNAVDMVMDRGHFYSDKPPIFALYSALVAYPLKWVISFDTVAGRRIFYYFITLTSSGLGLVGLSLLMRRALQKMSVPEADRDNIILFTVMGTCLLPTCLIYVTHTVESMLLMGTFLALLRYADRPGSAPVYWMGICTGLNIMVHPLVGGLYSMVTAAYFLIRRKGSDLVRFLIIVALLGAATLGLNRMLFGTFRPYYTMPEKFLFLVTDGKKIYRSGFMIDPTVQGLTEAMVRERFKEQGYSDVLRDQTIDRLKEYKASVGTYMGFALDNWRMWDFLFFNPLVIFCLLLIIKIIRRPSSQRKLECLWALSGIFFLYVSTIYQRSMPGGSFGNRYLVASLPPLFVLAASELKERSDRRWMNILFGFTFIGALLSTAHPWHTPSAGFRRLTLPIYLLLIALLVARTFSFWKIIERAFIVIPNKRILFFVVFGAWVGAEVAAYYWNMPDQFRADGPRIIITGGCLAIFGIYLFYDGWRLTNFFGGKKT